MKQTLTVAHARNSAPLFVQLSQIEIKKLRQLPAWMRWLYLELVALSNFDTGCLYVGSDPRVSYAKLAALLAHDENPQGGRQAPAPSHDQIRRGLDALEAAGLVVRDKVANEGARLLFLAVEARKSTVTASANRARGYARPAAPKKPRKINKIAQEGQGVAPEVAPGVSEGKFINTPNPQNDPHLSTSEGPKPPEASQPPGPIVVGAAGEKIGPPRGPDNRPLRGHAPQAPTATAKVMRARLRDQVGPPGGQDDAPQGVPAAGMPPSARIRRPRNTVLMDEAGEGLAAMAPAPEAEGPMCEWPRLRDGARWMQEQADRLEAQDGP